jgi:[acyl-carrier-protein] S-malonyltransferase
MKTALIFPGQGSQSVGMGLEFYQNFSYTQELVAEANDILGYDLWHIIQNDNEKLSQTIYTQVAMLLAGTMCHQVLQNETDIKPQMVAGHSLGEISALTAAGVISFADGVKITDKRARLMQNAMPVGVGAMAAILGLDDKIVINTCAEYNEEGCVEAVNFNAPGQVVIAGNKEAVEKTCETLKAKGAKRALVLPVSVPSHSSLMSGAATEFLSFLDEFDFNLPQTPVLHNVDAQVENDVQAIKQKLAKQLYNPVLWVRTINNMVESGINNVIEVGPGKVLAGLNRRTNKDLTTKMLFDLTTLEDVKNA